MGHLTFFLTLANHRASLWRNPFVGSTHRVRQLVIAISSLITVPPRKAGGISKRTVADQFSSAARKLQRTGSAYDGNRQSPDTR